MSSRQLSVSRRGHQIKDDQNSQKGYDQFCHLFLSAPRVLSPTRPPVGEEECQFQAIETQCKEEDCEEIWKQKTLLKVIAVILLDIARITAHHVTYN